MTFETDAAIKRVVAHGPHQIRGAIVAIDAAVPRQVRVLCLLCSLMCCAVRACVLCVRRVVLSPAPLACPTARPPPARAAHPPTHPPTLLPLPPPPPPPQEEVLVSLDGPPLSVGSAGCLGGGPLSSVEEPAHGEEAAQHAQHAALAAMGLLSLEGSGHGRSLLGGGAQAPF